MAAEEVQDGVGRQHRSNRKQGDRRRIQGTRRHSSSARNKSQCARYRHTDGFRKNNQADDNVSVVQDQ